MLTGDLQALVAVQGHPLQQRGQAVHPAQQHHHLGGGAQHPAEEEALQLAEALQQALGEDQELAGVAAQPEEVVPPAGHRGDVIAADPGLWDRTGEHGLEVGRPLLCLGLVDDKQILSYGMGKNKSEPINDQAGEQIRYSCEAVIYSVYFS